MKTSYEWSHALIPAGQQSLTDLVIHFKTDTESAQSVRRPLNLSVVIDRSGSMAGNSLKYAIKAAQNLVDRLTETDLFSVVIYDDDVDTILPPQPVTDKAAIKALIAKIRAGGCTNLSGGWLKGCDYVATHATEERVNRVLLLTDGQANSGIRDPKVLTQTAQEKAEQGISTTTLGFGSGFNEDLLIGMAKGGRGNFYFVQSPDDAVEVFGIELEGLVSVSAQNLEVTIHPQAGVQVESVLNNYRVVKNNGSLVVAVGDVYGVEDKLLALECAVTAGGATGLMEIAKLTYAYHTVVEGSIRQQSGECAVALTVGTAAEAGAGTPNASVIEQTNRLRIGKAKEEAVELADKGELDAAAKRLRKTYDNLKMRIIMETFEAAEELDQLDHFAQKIEKKQFDSTSRKEMRDQSYQALSRNRGDLKLRGASGGSAAGLAVVSTADQGVQVKCYREGGKLRMRVISDGYNQDFNVQFPRHLREEGVTYLVDEVNPSSDGSFYRAAGAIKRLVLPGQEHLYTGGGRVSKPRSGGPPKASSVAGTAADLETTDTVGTGVLVQCVKDGSKLRARVVSDGYDPNYNMRFPRSIREEGMLYVVDEVIEPSGGGSYIACGKIKRFVQPT
ncbi:MAG: VWA domain-containing protein [Blastocatellia bacterium]|nr:VWA domain-containing protein [Blastocatellia bacterium]